MRPSAAWQACTDAAIDAGSITSQWPASAADAVFGLAQRLGIAVHAKHQRAFLRKADRGGAAIAPAGACGPGAGDVDHLAGQTALRVDGGVGIKNRHAGSSRIFQTAKR